ncbi:MAG: efflux RND transporter periplasmic adaptor subunit, partial [Methylococcales bacterium]|nr:efflux RND transporter periplasmic adaptor subunit [Methylococcales bacterium]
GGAGAYTLIATRPVLEPEKPDRNIPVVTVIEAKPETLRLNVHSQGIVKPRHELDLTAEVAGKVTFLHSDFVAGGAFNKDELLVRIDSRDYDAAIVQAQAQIAEAKRQLATEQAQADQARTEWQALGTGQPSALVMREPQLTEARAKLKAAESTLLQATNQRSRCELRAPFTGRFYSKAVALGQVIQTGEKLARLYATDVAEIRLPIALEQLAYLDIALNDVKQNPVEVTLTAKLAGALQTWQAHIVRTEGTVDESTGVLYLVAEVQQPRPARFLKPRRSDEAPLLNGLFVEADIQGKTLDNVFALPQQAINAAQQVLIVDNHQQLHSRHLDVLRTEANRVLIQNGLQAGERIITSGIDLPIEGMIVQVGASQ